MGLIAPPQGGGGSLARAEVVGVCGEGDLEENMPGPGSDRVVWLEVEEDVGSGEDSGWEIEVGVRSSGGRWRAESLEAEEAPGGVEAVELGRREEAWREDAATVTAEEGDGLGASSTTAALIGFPPLPKRMSCDLGLRRFAAATVILLQAAARKGFTADDSRGDQCCSGGEVPPQRFRSNRLSQWPNKRSATEQSSGSGFNDTPHRQHRDSDELRQGLPHGVEISREEDERKRGGRRMKSLERGAEDDGW